MRILVAGAGLLIVALVYLALPEPRAQGDTAVRGMADFLERLEPAAASDRPLAGVANRINRRLAERAPGAAATAGGGTGAPAALPEPVRSELVRLESIERSLENRYPRTETGLQMRHYVALVLAEVDTEYRPDLSRLRALNDLMKDAPASVTEIPAVFGALPREGSEAERAALVTLVTYLGGHEQALPVAENILASEIGRRASGEEAAEEARLARVVDAYTSLVTDPQRRERFIRAGLEVQDRPRLRQVLQEYLERQKETPGS